MLLETTVQSRCGASAMVSFMFRSGGLTKSKRLATWRSGWTRTRPFRCWTTDSLRAGPVSDGLRTCPAGWVGPMMRLQRMPVCGRLATGVLSATDMMISPLQIRDEMLAHLQVPGFQFFEPIDVMDYTGLGEIWVRASVSVGCVVRMIYAYGTGRNTIEFVEHGAVASPAFYAELELLAAFWGESVAANTTE